MSFSPSYNHQSIEGLRGFYRELPRVELKVYVKVKKEENFQNCGESLYMKKKKKLCCANSCKKQETHDSLNETLLQNFVKSAS